MYIIDTNVIYYALGLSSPTGYDMGKITTWLKSNSDWKVLDLTLYEYITKFKNNNHKIRLIEKFGFEAQQHNRLMSVALRNLNIQKFVSWDLDYKALWSIYCNRKEAEAQIAAFFVTNVYLLFGGFAFSKHGGSIPNDLEYAKIFNSDKFSDDISKHCYSAVNKFYFNEDDPEFSSCIESILINICQALLDWSQNGTANLQISKHHEDSHNKLKKLLKQYAQSPGASVTLTAFPAADVYANTLMKNIQMSYIRMVNSGRRIKKNDLFDLAILSALPNADIISFDKGTNDLIKMINPTMDSQMHSLKQTWK